MPKMTVAEIAAHYLDSAPANEMLHQIEALVAIDRFQASHGIQEAAGRVARWAEVAGLENVSISQFAGDGRARWWTFAAPRSWTPRSAVAEIRFPDGNTLPLVDHQFQPMSLATYSHPTPPGGATYALVHRDAQDLPSCIWVMLLPRDAPYASSATPLARGASGFVTDHLARLDQVGGYSAGRVELVPGSPLFGLSVTPDQMHAVNAAAAAGARLHVAIDVDRDAAMPLVSAILPGEDDEEVWITSHLCHPRPGANDNASGVAATLGLASMLAAAKAVGLPGVRRTVRFLWGPEFLGTVAAIHDLAPPAFVLNLDMVGEDQALCASPFVVERCPSGIGGMENALVESCVAEVFRQTANGVDRWQSVPFTGFSDHCFFADASIRRPAVQFCHPADRFNHSAADTLDKVSALELRRTVAAAATALVVLERPYDAEIQGLIERWCMHERASTAVLAQSIGGQWGEALLAECWRCTSHLLTSPTCATPPAAAMLAANAPRRQWAGPLNVRAMLAALPAAARRSIDILIAEDKRTLSLLFATGMRIDGVALRHQIDQAVSFEARREIPDELTEMIWRCFLESHWI